VGIPWPFSLGAEDGITLPGGVSRICIYFRPGTFDPQRRGFFLLCAHELVHALQVQQSPASGRGLGLLNAFIFRYLTCFFTAWTAMPRRGNLYEDEAYEHEAILARALARAAQSLPGAPGFPGAAALARADPQVIKRGARVKGSCGSGAAGLGAALAAAAVTPLGAIVYAIAGAVQGAASLVRRTA
jgi:hypothetical protein